MVSQRFCQDCIQKHDCRSVYEQLGNSSGASVALKAILAFLLPLIVFIVSLAVSERVLAGAISIEGLQIALSFLIALLVTFVCVFITRIIIKQLGLDK
ncbi:hypothetical protein ACFL3Q_08485 [Planctomycetota bacterium]